MTKKIKKSYTASVQGVVDVDNDNILIEVEDYGVVSLSEFIKDFLGKEVKITISYSENED